MGYASSIRGPEGEGGRVWVVYNVYLLYLS